MGRHKQSKFVFYIQEDDIMDMLEKVEKGELIARHVDGDLGNGNVTFEIAVEGGSVSWGFVVFSDCGVFDYVAIVHHGNRRVRFEQLQEYFPRVKSYEISDELAKLRYGFPGY